jgi:two-component system, NtrC family, nitrogen regulation sensor histidine kinase NtrY
VNAPSGELHTAPLPRLAPRLKLRFGVYLALLHLALFAAAATVARERPWLFLLLEAALLASAVYGYRLLARALEPLAYTQHFHGLLHDGEYAARLRAPGHRRQPELEQLVQLFNAMLARLYEERLKLGEQQGLLDRLLEATPSAVIVFDFDGRISVLNAAATALLGVADPVGKPLRHWLENGAPAPRCASLLQQLDNLAPDSGALLSDSAGRRYRGQRGHFHDRGFKRQFLLVDELTAELADSEHATYDKLIRVLGHEVNNTVAATASVLDSLLYYRGQLAQSDADDFGTAIVAVKRRNVQLGEFIERFTRVVKMPAPELRPVDVGALLDGIAALYREPCRSRGITLAWGRRDAVPPLPMDSQLMEQALLNVVKNAMEAVEATMQERGAQGGAVTLALQAGSDGVRLSVTDSGRCLAGVPASQLFTPFFSTKKGGQGIGLLFVREVLNRHGFSHRLAADADGDTCFEIRLAPGA